VPFLVTETYAKKGGHRPPPAPADREIGYHAGAEEWGLAVMNAEGSNRTLIYSDSTTHIRSPSSRRTRRSRSGTCA
jgi:hypothetical protein